MTSNVIIANAQRESRQWFRQALFSVDSIPVFVYPWK